MLAWEFEGKRYYIGDTRGWLNSKFELVLEHPVYGPRLKTYFWKLNQRKKFL